MSSIPNDFYDPFYRGGGFKFDLRLEMRFMEDVLLPIAGWKPPERIIEIGAGMGHHSELLRSMGFDVTAVEASETGAVAAKELYPSLDVVNADAAAYRPTDRGHVFARGMSWYHYELTGTNHLGVDVPAETARIFRDFMAPGHTFVLQIVTDLSGNRPYPKVHNNTVEDYLNLFRPLGSVKVFDWAGTRLTSLSRRAHRGVIVATRK